MMNDTHFERYRWHAAHDERALQQAAREIVLSCAQQAIEQRGQFHLVLAGGNTPRGLYHLLCTTKTDWTAWHIWFGDERCLPPGDPARNAQMAAEVWLDAVPIPGAQTHSIAGELGAQLAAQRYAEALQGIDDFDLVLLGLGEDGHTASLFPGHEWGTAADAADALAVLNAPKPPTQRVSLSAMCLSRTRKAFFLVSGESKRLAVANWRKGESIPARAIMPRSGVDILAEAALLAA